MLYIVATKKFSSYITSPILSTLKWLCRVLLLYFRNER